MYLTYPDDPLPALQMSLPDLVEAAGKLLEEDKVDEFVHLMLGGRCIDEQETEHRVFVNGLQDLEAASEDTCTLTFDFDSAILVTPRLPIRGALSVTPVPSFKYTLKKSVHITYPVTIRGVRAQ